MRRSVTRLDQALEAAHPGLVPADVAPLVRLANEVSAVLRSPILSALERQRILDRALGLGPSPRRTSDVLRDAWVRLRARRPAARAAVLTIATAAVLAAVARGRAHRDADLSPVG
jgi:hypothetical protein